MPSVTTWNGACACLQNPDPDTKWKKPISEEGGVGWTDSEIKIWLHRLGNLCAVSDGKNAGLSNKDFEVKKDQLFSFATNNGYSAALTAMRLASKDFINTAWNKQAIIKNQDFYLERLAERWGAPSWQEMRSAQGKGDDTWSSVHELVLLHARRNLKACQPWCL